MQGPRRLPATLTLGHVSKIVESQGFGYTITQLAVDRQRLFIQGACCVPVALTVGHVSQIVEVGGLRSTMAQLAEDRQRLFMQGPRRPILTLLARYHTKVAE